MMRKIGSLEIRFPDRYINVLAYFGTETEIKLDFTKCFKCVARAAIAGRRYYLPLHEIIRAVAMNRSHNGIPLKYTVPLYEGDEDIAEFYRNLPRGQQARTIGDLLSNAIAPVPKRTTRNRPRGEKHTAADYDDCRVDPGVPHNLDEDLEHTHPAGFSIRGERINVSKWKDMLPALCEHLYSIDGARFSELAEAQIKTNRKTYLGIGQRYNTVRVADSNIYVSSDLGAKPVCRSVAEILEFMNIPQSEFKFFLKSDFRALHQK